jgi:catechol 2,3-dioxygenase-like lactoylglutathione lyase family enzyme
VAFKLEHVHLKSKDPDNTAKFYMEILGAKLIEQTSTHGGYRLSLDGLTVNITGFIADQTRQQQWGLEHFALETDDLEGDLAKLEAHGARELERMPNRIRGGDLQVCFVECPDGVQLELIETKS